MRDTRDVVGMDTLLKYAMYTHARTHTLSVFCVNMDGNPLLMSNNYVTMEYNLSFLSFSIFVLNSQKHF